MVLVVGGAGKSPTTSLLITDVRPLSSVCADVYFPYVGGGKGSLTSLKGALKGALTLNSHCMNRYIYFFDISLLQYEISVIISPYLPVWVRTCF